MCLPGLLQNSVTLFCFVLSTFAWCHFVCCMLAIHVTDKIANKDSDEMIQYFVVSEFFLMYVF